mmetsp:Transcript_40144/g.38647  ORF Transcript_40144/g.38647 Transcript_40144/m.38647 type:complete len:95 (-) Transcript_40144:322-606(-)
MSAIPYGIAVFNFDKIYHFNQPMQQMLDFSNPKDLLLSLANLRRKIKKDSPIQKLIDQKSKGSETAFDKLMPPDFTDLYKDLQFLMKNRKESFQ